MSPSSDLIEVPGEVSGVIETTTSAGDRAYRAEYVYEVEGRSYEATSAVTSSSRPTVGTPVTDDANGAKPARSRGCSPTRWPSCGSATNSIPH